MACGESAPGSRSSRPRAKPLGSPANARARLGYFLRRWNTSIFWRHEDREALQGGDFLACRGLRAPVRTFKAATEVSCTSAGLEVKT